LTSSFCFEMRNVRGFDLNSVQMNIKVFNIRLSKEFCHDDQTRMNAFLDSVEVKLTSTNFVTTGNTDYWSVVIFYTLKQPKKQKEKAVIFVEELSQQEMRIFQALKLWRNDLAKKLEWSSFRICHNSHLLAVAKSNPQTLEELASVPGFGKTRTEKYGAAILTVLNTL
jgi:superfamily II DNA helicase RecQ